MIKRFLPAVLICVLFAQRLDSQTHLSVPLDDGVYDLIEKAALRGLCFPPPGAKPWTRAQAADIIADILNRDDDGRLGALSADERRILSGAALRFGTPGEGLDLPRGAYYFDIKRKDGLHLSVDIDFNIYALLSGAFNSQGDVFDGGGELFPSIGLYGDIGRSFSYAFNIYGIMLYAPREYKGTYHTYYDGYEPADTGNADREIPVHGGPPAFFPYTYKKHWDGFLWEHNNINNSDFLDWPDVLSLGYAAMPETGGVIFNGIVSWRAGRVEHEWAAMSPGSSLVFNRMARPFFALEMTARPAGWVTFSSLTGILEYYNGSPGPDGGSGLKASSETFQNAYSIMLLEFNYKNYIHLDWGSAAVWVKRFDPGYIFPLMVNFLYQNNTGDYDNIALFGNVKLQYPGIGNVWFSLYLDEMNVGGDDFMKRVNSRYAFQTGVRFHIPLLSFSSAELRYTKIEPYCYTHSRLKTPWYDSLYMEEAYINNGVPIGYYLPPNSDELLLRLETMPAADTAAHIQYQMIRHGADYGSGYVWGSSFYSEIADTEANKYFLHDGAYQWLHILKAGGERALMVKGAVPFSVFGDFGVVFSYFTDTGNRERYPAASSKDYHIVNTDEYPRRTSVILTVGFKVFY